MSILLYAESENGKLKKAALELASYAKAIADQISTTVIAVVINAQDTELLQSYGVSKVVEIKDQLLDTFNAKAYAQIFSSIAKQEQSDLVLLGSSADAKYIAPILAIQLERPYISNVIALPIQYEPLQFKRTAFTNKALMITQLNEKSAVVGLSSNSFGLKQSSSDEFTVVSLDINYDKQSFEQFKLESLDKELGKVTIADADVVVSGGRGLKGPENWHLIEDLAEVLGAATACSKPVSDMGWRPHGEHVGQTGKPVASNLYIAIGISGAIQHLAGVNASKVKLVINSDPEAPFFKAADYGIVGDAFDVVPRLIEKLKAFKANA